VRAVALDVHRDFCEVAIVAEGRLRSAGRIEARPEALELFGRSLDRRDWVALEVTAMRGRSRGSSSRTWRA